MIATVYKSTGSWYLAKDEQGIMWKARVRGKFKIDKEITSTNPIAVGDIVTLNIEDEKENVATIIGIAPRKNYLVRVSVHNRNMCQIIASNIDQALIIATIKSPRTSLGFIDRFVVMAELHGVTPVIVFNKIDLLNKAEKEILKDYTSMYNNIGYKVIHTSTLKPKTIQNLIKELNNKCTLFTGHSGVGKSTVVNLLIPELDLATSEVSEWSQKGLHTTTFAEMHNLNTTAAIIDTPGIRELGIININKQELSGYFKEINVAAKNCKYNNCMHLSETQCAVQQAVKDNAVDARRFESYVSILATMEK